MVRLVKGGMNITIPKAVLQQYLANGWEQSSDSALVVPAEEPEPPTNAEDSEEDEYAEDISLNNIDMMTTDQLVKLADSYGIDISDLGNKKSAIRKRIKETLSMG